MLDRIEGSFAGDHDAKTKIGAAVKYLLRDLRGSAHDDAVREIIDIVQGVANEPSSRQDVPDSAATPAPMGSVSYKSYVIDAFRRDTDRWRSTIRRQDGKKIRIASPPAVVDHATTGSDALTAEKAVEFAKRTIDAGGVM
ncbi:hypothetical protein JQ604_30195 [Bradyrhizobium jicamae]|uniref:hypothetical protein n=1 Tax=Bradyrhizobium jicamae TaxID=280332 RepID=UPI001BA9CE7D|nr:hypothetical protein [Bradyrhizobium jicamae]MBR0756470.1 hypothetical protein [Bradyrhizobium jicamae]